MKTTQTTYPIFEANQVLSSEHLNNEFDYLDEQARLTRANLIGIGIVCGLEVTFETNTIRLTKGCGVTSEGYLIVQSEDVTFGKYQPYILPNGDQYAPFLVKNASGKEEQVALWELLKDGATGTALNLPDKFLDDKVALLFLELNNKPLKNCEAGDCDDKGREIIATVRPLLIQIANLDKIVAIATKSAPDLSPKAITDTIAARLNLPDLRLPRYDVPNTSPITSADVLAGFQNAIKQATLVANMQKALSAAYAAFKLINLNVTTDPFANFTANFGFLDTALTSPEQVQFLQYYYDFLDDLIQAYDEFRWKGIDLLCLCCPPEDLFPRHLILGQVALGVNKANDRQGFLASPAVSRCGPQVAELQQLFARMVEMIQSFTNPPQLRAIKASANEDPQIRITPSVLGRVALSDKAIPYYYSQKGMPPLYALWNAERTRRNRANQNLGYRADEYKPTAPSFVTDPLRYDLEPYNFLRIEGHLGKDYQAVLRTLLALKLKYRLPIEFVALRTGAFDETQPIDLAKEAAHFQDLEAIYDTLREELTCFLCDEVQYFYNITVDSNIVIKTPKETKITPKLPLLIRCAENFQVQPETWGQLLEQILSNSNTKPSEFARMFIAWDENIGRVFWGNDPEAIKKWVVLAFIFSISLLSDTLIERFSEFDFEVFKKQHKTLQALAEIIENYREKNLSSNLTPPQLLNWEEIDDRLEAIIYQCRFESLHALYKEYQQRLKEIKHKLFLKNFLQKHPGIQHKAGVPIGGTFVLAYHGKSVTMPRQKESMDDILINGVVVADFYLPYLISSDYTPIQVTLPKTPPIFTIKVECTSEGKAKVNIKPNNKDRDYWLKIDNQTYQLLKSPIELAVGSHTLILKDDEDTESLPQTFVIQPELSITSEKITCNEAQQYTVSFVIKGGTAPYKVNRGTVDGEGNYISDALSNKTDIEIIITDSRGCKLIKKSNHDCPSPLAFTAQVGCTDGMAPVTITASGGVSPYHAIVNNDDKGADNLSFDLLPGSYDVWVQDSASPTPTKTSSQTVTVPQQLAINEPKFIDDTTAQTYQVQFKISGGTRPYAVNGKNIGTDSYISGSIKSGDPFEAKITDAAGCSRHRQFSHVVIPPCDLPCNGKAIRCGYRFWLPERNPDFTSFSIKTLKFTFDFPKLGKTNDITAQVKVINPPTFTDLNSDFNTAVDIWLKDINDKIFNETKIKDGLKLTYTKGTLFIERFNCLPFTFEIQPVYKRGDISERPTFTYSETGTDIKIANKTTHIPAFDCIEIDKCAEGNPQRSLCVEPSPTVTINSIVSSDRQTVNLTATPSNLSLYIWEIEASKEIIITGTNPTFTFGSPMPQSPIVRLTAFTDKGCKVTAQTTI